MDQYIVGLSVLTVFVWKNKDWIDKMILNLYKIRWGEEKSK